MSSKYLPKLNSLAALSYALGVWTMLGALGVYSYSTNAVEKGDEVRRKEEEAKERSSTGYYSKTVITYKENAIPFTSKIYNFFNRFGDEPGPGDAGK